MGGQKNRIKVEKGEMLQYGLRARERGGGRGQDAYQLVRSSEAATKCPLYGI